MAARWLATLAVVSHGVVVWFHGAAHKELGVGLATAWERIFVDVVILVAPVVALILIWTPLKRCGYLTLALSMAGTGVWGLSPFHRDLAGSCGALAAGRRGIDVQNNGPAAGCH